MKILKTKFKDLLIFRKTTHNDDRGYFRELFIQNKIKKKFVFDYLSLSKKNVIRGIHIQLQKPQAKFITVFSGEIFDVVIDCRKNLKLLVNIFHCTCLQKRILHFIFLHDLRMVFAAYLYYNSPI